MRLQPEQASALSVITYNHTRMHVDMHTSPCTRMIDHDVAYVHARHVNVKRNEVNAAAGGHHLAAALIVIMIVPAAGFQDAVKNFRMPRSHVLQELAIHSAHCLHFDLVDGSVAG